MDCFLIMVRSPHFTFAVTDPSNRHTRLQVKCSPFACTYALFPNEVHPRSSYNPVQQRSIEAVYRPPTRGVTCDAPGLTPGCRARNNVRAWRPHATRGSFHVQTSGGPA